VIRGQGCRRCSGYAGGVKSQKQRFRLPRRQIVRPNGLIVESYAGRGDGCLASGSRAIRHKHNPVVAQPAGVTPEQRSTGLCGEPVLSAVSQVDSGEDREDIAVGLPSDSHDSADSIWRDLRWVVDIVTPERELRYGP